MSVRTQCAYIGVECAYMGRIRKRVSVTLRPDLYDEAKKRGLDLSALLDGAVAEALHDPARVEQAPVKAVKPEWQPDDLKLAEKVRAVVCVVCKKKQPESCVDCERFRRAYEARSR